MSMTWEGIQYIFVEPMFIFNFAHSLSKHKSHRALVYPHVNISFIVYKVKRYQNLRLQLIPESRHPLPCLIRLIELKFVNRDRAM